MTASLPLLYSFRRCPYAMRARLALYQSGTHCILREVLLRRKPQALLDVSPKGTVPVLITPEGRVLEESLDIMQWSLEQNDPAHWLPTTEEKRKLTDHLIQQNDGPFKYHLDRYKYPGRYDDSDPVFHRTQAMKIIARLEVRLAATDGGLISLEPALADYALLPFIRQFAATDQDWFGEHAPKHVKNWLETFLSSSLFESIMHKYKPWQEGEPPVFTLPAEI